MNLTRFRGVLFLNLRLLLGYIAVLLGLMAGLYNIYFVLQFTNPIVVLAFLGGIVYSISGLIAIKLSSKDNRLSSLLFLISGIGILFTMRFYGIPSFILFLVSSILEFRIKNKVKVLDISKRRKIFFIQLLMLVLIPILLVIQSWFIIYV